YPWKKGPWPTSRESLKSCLIWKSGRPANLCRWQRLSSAATWRRFGPSTRVTSPCRANDGVAASLSSRPCRFLERRLGEVRISPQGLIGNAHGGKYRFSIRRLDCL